MKCLNRKNTLLLILILAFTLSLINFTRPTVADDTAITMYVSPQTPTINSTLNFTANIMIKNVYQMTSYQAYVYWDPTILGLTSIINGAFLNNNSQIPTQSFKSENDAAGYLAYTEVQVVSPPPGHSALDYAVGTGSGNATLYQLVFTAKGTGQCPIHLNNTIVKLLTDTLSNEVQDGYFNNQQITYNNAGTNYTATIMSNSTVHDLSFNLSAKTIAFNVSGPTGTTGYANITVPKQLLDVDPVVPPSVWVLYLDGAPTTSFTVTTNSTCTFIYLTYTHSDHSILLQGNKVLPEITLNLYVLFLMLAAAALLPVLVQRRRHQETRQAK